jgi:uncharacterized protein YecE (DUF72 family)
MLTVKVGCCGFPRGRQQYFSRFKLVEVQQTFYKLPLLDTALRWREESPPDFEFSLKAWQLITHPSSSPTYRKAGLKLPPGKEDCYGFFQPTAEVKEAWSRTEEIARALRAKVVVFQCPARFEESPRNIDNLRNFFSSLARGDLLFAWEPRGNWSEKTVRALCQELGLLHCVDPLERRPLYGEINYFRLHGGPGYRHSYSNTELARLREMIDKDTYVLFNNITMYDDALRFIKLWGEAVD